MLEADWPTPDSRLASFNLSRLPSPSPRQIAPKRTALLSSTTQPFPFSPPLFTKIAESPQPTMSFLTSLRPTTTIHHLLRPSPFSLSQSLLQQPTRSFTASPTSRLARMSIIGRLADTPEIVATSSGQDIVKYALGTSHGPKDQRQTTWWKVSSFVGDGAGKDLLLGLGKGWVFVSLSLSLFFLF